MQMYHLLQNLRFQSILQVLKSDCQQKTFESVNLMRSYPQNFTLQPQFSSDRPNL